MDPCLPCLGLLPALAQTQLGIVDAWMRLAGRVRWRSCKTTHHAVPSFFPLICLHRSCFSPTADVCKGPRTKGHVTLIGSPLDKLEPQALRTIRGQERRLPTAQRKGKKSACATLVSFTASWSAPVNSFCSRINMITSSYLPSRLLLKTGRSRHPHAR